MAGIQIGGLASGMDTESIITQLMSIERRRARAPRAKQVTVQARQDALRQIDTKLTNLKLAAGDLRSAAIWSPKQTVSSGNESVLTARQRHRRRPRRLHRQRLLAGQRGLAHLPWNAGGGNLTVDYKTATAAHQTKTFDLTGMSLDDAVSTINSDARLARVGGQRRRQAVAVAPRHRRPRQLGLRRLRAGHRRA